ncbi:hypothetical protein SUGI_1063640 [Cryptomeria japonica]|nr:hypothetical protein SUGI_1063640 [Cryptomeria japonica]
MYAKINSTDDYDSAWDYFDHGSHTSSIPLGNYLASVSFFGYACGTARGMAPAGRVAMHKIIWSIGITVSDVLPAWRAPLRMELMFSLFLLPLTGPHLISKTLLHEELLQPTKKEFSCLL